MCRRNRSLRTFFIRLECIEYSGETARVTSFLQEDLLKHYDVFLNFEFNFHLSVTDVFRYFAQYKIELTVKKTITKHLFHADNQVEVCFIAEKEKFEYSCRIYSVYNMVDNTFGILDTNSQLGTFELNTHIYYIHNANVFSSLKSLHKSIPKPTIPPKTKHTSSIQHTHVCDYCRSTVFAFKYHLKALPGLWVTLYTTFAKFNLNFSVFA